MECASGFPRLLIEYIFKITKMQLANVRPSDLTKGLYVLHTNMRRSSTFNTVPNGNTVLCKVMFYECRCLLTHIIIKFDTMGYHLTPPSHPTTTSRYTIIWACNVWILIHLGWNWPPDRCPIQSNFRTLYYNISLLFIHLIIDTETITLPELGQVAASLIMLINMHASLSSPIYDTEISYLYLWATNPLEWTSGGRW